MALLSRASRIFRRSGSVADDITTGARTSAKSFGRGATSPLGIAGVSIGGAYGYGEYSDYQEEKQQTDRYDQYQQSLDQIQTRYENGDISKREMKALKEQARNEYYAAQGDEQRGLTAMQVIGQMSSFQLAAFAGGVGFVSYFLLRPLMVAILRGSPSMEGLLG